MDHIATIEQLAEAEDHVARGERHIARQRRLIADMERDGKDTFEEKGLLSTLQEIQALHIAERDRLVTILAFERRSAQPPTR
jgi:hypothetical protein